MNATDRLISSQRYRDPEVIAEKSEASDYVVHIVTIVVDGSEYDVVVDGHHSLSAAIEDGEEPEIEVNEALQLEADRDPLAFLEAHHLGDDYHFVTTGRPVW